MIPIGWIKQNIIILILILIGSCLLIANLGNQYLWQDEAQTCLISKTILERGLPYGTDGKNFFSQELGAEYGEDYIWKWHTWLPFYVQAIFFWLFGTSNFIARLPFALFGIGSVIYTYLLSKKLFSKETALLTVVLLITNVGFLILSRQARMYSPSIMFSAAILYYFLLIKEHSGLSLKKNKLSNLWFVLFTTFLFHTHYFYYATFFISIGLYLLLFKRNKIKHFVLPTIISGTINLPWIIWFRNLKYHETYGFNFNKYMLWRFFKGYSYSMYKNMSGEWMIFVLFAVLLFVFFKKNKIIKKVNSTVKTSALLLITYIGISFLFLCLFTPVEEFRYLSTLYIPIILLISIGVNTIYKYNKYLSILIVIGFISINSIDKYLYEITNDFNGPIEGIVSYLNKHADPNDKVLITYGDLPVKWYTGLKTFGGLTGEGLVKNADWVIYRKHTICEKDQAVKDFIDNNVNLTNYKKIELDYPDYKFENREDPLLRLFKRTKEDRIIIYKNEY